ncbi:MAG: SIMPL domain-containing protein [Burkholderiaceae bacterium]
MNSRKTFQAISKIIAATAIYTLASSVFGQNFDKLEPKNHLQLSASGQVEVAQDYLTLSLATTREAADAAAVQSQLKAAVDAALQEAKKTALAGQMEVRTGNFSLYPRYGKDGKITAWQGSAELVLEGRDFARISAAAGKVAALTVSGVAFSLSREQRLKVEGEAQAQAIERFKAKASEIAKGFGFGGYTLRELNVSSSDQSFVGRPRLAAAEARFSSADAPVPVEAGKAAVVVTVSGSVQMK